MLSSLSLAALGCPLLGSESVIASTLNGLFTNIGSEFALPMTDRLRKALLRKHPEELNHDLQLALSEAIRRALQNIKILYKECYPNDPFRWMGTDFLEDLHKEVNKLFSPEKRRTITDEELKEYLFEKNDVQYERLLETLEITYIKTNYNETFSAFFKEHFLQQIQFSFSQVLKESDYKSARIAFEKMLMEEIRNDVKEILEGQKRIEQGIANLQDKLQLQQIGSLTDEQAQNILNDPEKSQKFEIAFDNALNDHLDVLKNKIDELYLLAWETKKSTQLLIQTVTKKLTGKRTTIAIAFAIMGVTIAASISYYYQLQPFPLTVKVHGPAGVEDNVLEDRGFVTIIYPAGSPKEPLNNGMAYFKKIPGSMRGDSATIIISGIDAEPYRQICDTCKFELLADGVIHLPLVSYGLDKLSGTITDENNVPIRGALITVQDIEATTTAEGRFFLVIPYEKQKRRQTIHIAKAGYVTESIEEYPVHLNPTKPLNIPLKKAQP